MPPRSPLGSPKPQAKAADSRRPTTVDERKPVSSRPAPGRRIPTARQAVPRTGACEVSSCASHIRRGAVQFLAALALSARTNFNELLVIGPCRHCMIELLTNRCVAGGFELHLAELRGIRR